MSRKRAFENLKSKYCCEDISKIENYEKAKKDNFIGWCIHHRDEIKVLPSGITVIRSHKELIENGRYYDCPANELIFMTNFDHQKLHSSNRSKNTLEKMRNIKLGKKATIETKNKMSNNRKGKSHESYNSGWKHTEEWCMKAKERAHNKSDFYKKFGMTIEDYIKINKLSCSCSTIRRKFKNGGL